MLMNCPECELQVSDHAIACPHCGYPINAEKRSTKHSKAVKHRRLPNGFGQISEIKNRNLRNPYRAMVTVGKTELGRPICKPLKPHSYFKTYNEAYTALVEYHKSPVDLDATITVQELYDRWSEEYFKTIDYPGPTRTAWKYCGELYSMRVCDLRARHIKHCLEEGVAMIKGIEKKPTASTKNAIKTLFNQMMDYAVEYELTDRNYARTFNLSKDVFEELHTTKNEHKAYTEEELNIIWSQTGSMYFADLVLVQCYTGWRPIELLSLTLENINLEEGTMRGGSKTESGRDRIVPIHSKISMIVKRMYEEAERIGSEYLFFQAKTGNVIRKLTYDTYRNGLNNLIVTLKIDPEHRPHDGRKTFVTLAKRSNVDEYALKYIVGHKISDITERVYTERTNTWLKDEIEKIK